MAFTRQESAGYLANQMARLFEYALRERIEPLGIVPGQFPALLALWEEDGLTQKQLVERTNVEQATMANTLARMERDGLVRRTPHPGDARAQMVHLTTKAMNLRSAAISAASEVNDRALGGLSGAERAAFIGLMQRVIGALRERQGD